LANIVGEQTSDNDNDNDNDEVGKVMMDGWMVAFTLAITLFMQQGG